MNSTKATHTFQFELIHQSKRSHARVGKIWTPHGVINTPGFVAVGTNGALKSIDSETVEQLGLELMFCNTYHLLLQPGPKTVESAGGLHKFIGRRSPIITDSGGFQVFSLAYGGVADELKSRGQKKSDGHVLSITEEGVTFRSYRCGSKVLLTPETSVQAQKALGSDIIIPLDELPPYHIGKEALHESFERTHRWEIRSLNEHLQDRKNQAMYAVVHGGIDLDLRKESCRRLAKHPFDGFAIGGSMGKTREEMFSMLSHTLPHLPKTHPNHLLGIADLPSLNMCIPLGIDTFDSSYPTKAARHGTLLTNEGSLNLTRGAFAHDFAPIEEGCHCPTCQTTSRAYLRHLFKAKELTALTLASIHNLAFMIRTMKEIRQKILEDAI